MRELAAGNLHEQQHGENTAVLCQRVRLEEEMSYWKNKLGDSVSNVMGIKSWELVHGLPHLMEKVSSLNY